MLTRRKVLLTLFVLGAIGGLYWVGLAMWKQQQLPVYYARVAQARQLRGKAQYTEAEVEYRAAFALARRIFGPAHPKTLCTQMELINVRLAAGNNLELGRLLNGTGLDYAQLVEQDYRAPGELTNLLERYRLPRPHAPPFCYVVFLDESKAVPHLAHPLEEEGRDALAELISRRHMTLQPTLWRKYSWDLARELRRQERYLEAMIPAQKVLDFDESKKDGDDAKLPEDRLLIRELEDALQHDAK